MIYSNLKLWRMYRDIIVPPNGIGGKNVCFIFFGENCEFFDVINYINIKRAFVRYIYMPRTKLPVVSFMTPMIRKKFLSYKLLPLKSLPGDFSATIKKNYYYDTSFFVNRLLKRWKNVDRYNSGLGKRIIDSLLGGISAIPADTHEKVLIYSVNLDEGFSKNIFYKKFYPIFSLLTEWEKNKEINLPFDKIFLFAYSKKAGGIFYPVFGKEYKNNNIPRIRQILLNIKPLDKQVDEDFEKETISNKSAEEVSNKMSYLGQPEEEKKNIFNTVKNSVSTYLNTVPSKELADIKTQDKSQLATTSLFYHSTGDPDKSKAMANNAKSFTPNIHHKILKRYIDEVIPKEKPETVSKNLIVKHSKPETLVAGTPKHILDKRKKDFIETFQVDIKNSFKILESVDFPFKIKSISKHTHSTSSGEIEKSIRDRFTVKLENYKGTEQEVVIEVPHLTKNGTFLIYGQEKVLTNQMVRYPIYFPNLDKGVFHSSYATLSIENKRLGSKFYYIIHIAGYKIPLAMFFIYKVGLEEALRLFGVSFKIEELPVKDKDFTVKLGDKKFINFNCAEDNLAGIGFIESFRRSIISAPSDLHMFDILTPNYWRRILENDIGNRNCTYNLDLIYSFIVTPVEESILHSKNDPTNIKDIIVYICKEIIKGRIDDWNSLDRLRVRTSELFISLLQKQILAAYNDYKAKVHGGDTDAPLYINSTKVLADIILSQNVNTLENINPIEELSMMTKITPIGIGGLGSSVMFPNSARNIHYTYYGNIDPLETPDSEQIGITQHLTVGSSITGDKGLFSIKDRSQVKPGEILSVSPSLVPFVSHDDGVRILMATNQIKQAIPLKNPENPAIQSGYESVLTPLLSDNFIKKSPVNGTVIEINDLEIIIKDSEEVLHAVDIKPILLKSGQGVNGLGVFKPTVSIGDKVRIDQIIAEGSNIKNGLISNGVNLLAAFMPWKGYNFEDGMVVGESVVKKLTSLHIISEDIFIEPDEDVLFMAALGSMLNKGDIIISHSNTIYDVETLKNLRTDGGKLVNIEIFSNLPEDKIPEALKEQFELFRERYTLLNKKYPIEHFSIKGKKFEGIYIKFTLQKESELEKGDKINNRHFNKGIVSKVLPDSEMPVTPWGERIDILYNPLAIINRMNPGQLMELHTGLISRNLAQLMGTASKTKFISLLTKVMEFLDGTEDKKYSKNLIGYLKSISDTEYEKVAKQVTESRFFSLIFPPFSETKIEDVLNALEVLGLKPRYKLWLPEYNKWSNPIAVGYIYVVKLEHISENKIYSRAMGKYTSVLGSPTAGKKNEGGQKIGEYELYSLLCWDTPHLIDEFYGALSTDHVAKNEIVSEIVRTGKGHFVAPKTNSVRDNYSSLMLALHLEST